MILEGRLEALRHESVVLRDNALGDPFVRELYVYLPPAYDEGGRFPVVYLLPGFLATHRSILGFDPFSPNTIERFDRQVATERCRPAIVALPDCMTRFGGSQFLDSPATGRYQSYLADEIVPLVDRTFRTIAEPAGRVAAGRSSGGFGALRWAMDRPGMLGAVVSHAGDAAFDVSLRPTLTSAAIAFNRAGGLERFAARILEGGPKSQADFDALFVLATAMAYAPELDAPFPRCELPVDPATGELRPDVWRRFLDHDPLERVARAATALRELALVFVDAGDRDEHGLQFAARRLASALREAGVEVAHEEHEGGHRGTSYRYETSLPRILAALPPT